MMKKEDKVVLTVSKGEHPFFFLLWVSVTSQHEVEGSGLKPCVRQQCLDCFLLAATA